MKKWILVFLLLMTGCESGIVRKDGIDEKKLIETVNTSQSGMLYEEKPLSKKEAMDKLGMGDKQVSMIYLYEPLVSIDNGFIALVTREDMKKAELKQIIKNYVKEHNQNRQNPLDFLILSYDEQDIVMVSENCGTIKESIKQAE